MILDGMLLLWITFNLLDLQYLIVFSLVKINLPVSNKAASAFKTGAAIMNPVAIATFFDKTCKAIFDHLFAARSNGNGLFGSCQLIWKPWRLMARVCFISIAWFSLKA